MKHSISCRSRLQSTSISGTYSISSQGTRAPWPASTALVIIGFPPTVKPVVAHSDGLPAITQILQPLQLSLPLLWEEGGNPLISHLLGMLAVCQHVTSFTAEGVED